VKCQPPVKPTFTPPPASHGRPLLNIIRKTSAFTANCVKVRRHYSELAAAAEDGTRLELFCTTMMGGRGWTCLPTDSIIFPRMFTKILCRLFHFRQTLISLLLNAWRLRLNVWQTGACSVRGLLVNFVHRAWIHIKSRVKSSTSRSWATGHRLHMGSHSVTCHPTQVNEPCLNPSQ